MSISVVVPTYNRRATLEDTIGNLRKQTLGSGQFEVVVVDDASVDDTRTFMERVAEANANIKYIRHNENKGRVATRNDGISAATGEIVIFLDDDNVPSFDFVEAHLLYHKAYASSPIAVMGNVRFASDIVRRSNFAKYIDAQYLGGRLETRKGLAGIDLTDLPAKYLGTLNCSVRKADLETVGGFDRDLRHYGGEDVYLGHRLRGVGVRIVFGAAAKSIHHDEVTLQRFALKYRESTREGLRVIHGKDPSFVEGTRLSLLTPPSLWTDSLQRTVQKIGVRILLNRPFVSALERWAKATDHYPRLYTRLPYRLLLAGWYLQGFASEPAGNSEVQYAPR